MTVEELNSLAAAASYTFVVCLDTHVGMLVQGCDPDGACGVQVPGETGVRRIARIRLVETEVPGVLTEKYGHSGTGEWESFRSLVVAHYLPVVFLEQCNPAKIEERAKEESGETSEAETSEAETSEAGEAESEASPT